MVERPRVWWSPTEGFIEECPLRWPDDERRMIRTRDRHVVSIPEDAVELCPKNQQLYDSFYRNQRKMWIFPKFNHYRVSDSKLFTLGLNRYPHHVIGAFVVVGHHSFGVRWARLGRA